MQRQYAMPDVYPSMPPADIPPNTREAVLSRKAMWRLNVRLALEPLLFAIACGLYCVFLGIIILYGVRDLPYITPCEYGTVILSVCLFYSIIAGFTLFSAHRRMKLYGITLAHGYTRDVFYAASVYGQSVNRWEFYSRWKEIGGFFLLAAQGRWFILPKDGWAETELDELRDILRKKVGKAYQPATSTPREAP